MISIRKYQWTLILFLTLSTAAVSSAQTPVDPRDLIHFGDLIDVDVVGNFDFDWRGSLNPEGFLDGIERTDAPIYGLCRSEADVAADIQREYAKYLRDPRVVVKVLDRSNRAVAYLDGAVRFPQRFSFRRPVHLNELLILSGGLTDNASGEITIFRPANLSCQAQSLTETQGFVKASQPGGSQTMRIKIADLLRGIKEANPRIVTGDIVTVVKALPIYVIGGVNAPRPIASRSQMTVSRAIDAAGGISKDAVPSQVTIFRREGADSTIIEADLEKIRKGQAADVELKPYDIVEVPQEGRAKSTFPPVIENLESGRMSLTKLPLRIVD